MKISIFRKFGEYILNNYLGNFLGFVVGLTSARLVAHFFTTRSIRNVWGLFSRKTVINKHTYTNLEWVISLIVGFIVCELVSKWITKKLVELLPKYRLTKWMTEEQTKAAVAPAEQTAEKQQL